ncbi:MULTISPECIES: cyclodeaminase/cyclohydrolase family protein [Proteiniphilum]|jgi:formiminotetrahydrofolate cyclodeaminase|uniref:cyclodeaminase/cyclohydrolase family protein n=1 Tax=Proteiniphilum TaxID=294702 RepID=UPI001EEAA280|nr:MULTISPECIES: cyclodeaminase/cyclohydrolase family protein [Proteiniphilum]ULB33954.1 cyclodeaminase/cyclohydrolase family protein [Proteiniphilum propionicum]
MRLQDLTLKQFLEKTAGKEPLPGGGSSSALNGAIAAALTEMMANLTIGKKNYADAEAMMKQNLHKASDLRMRFIEDIDRDSDAYNLVISAYKLPKETEEEKEYRTGKIQEATKIASLVPMEVAERASGMLGIIAETVKSGNKNAVTDGCVAMLACRTAILGALLNVRINLRGIRDDKFVSELSLKCDLLEKEAINSERELFEWAKNEI